MCSDTTLQDTTGHNPSKLSIYQITIPTLITWTLTWCPATQAFRKRIQLHDPPQSHRRQMTLLRQYKWEWQGVASRTQFTYLEACWSPTKSGILDRNSTWKPPWPWTTNDATKPVWNKLPGRWFCTLIHYLEACVFDHHIKHMEVWQEEDGREYQWNYEYCYRPGDLTAHSD